MQRQFEPLEGRAHTGLVADEDGRAEALLVILRGGADHGLVLAFREDDALGLIRAPLR